MNPTEQPKPDWWPKCKKCGRVVDSVVVNYKHPTVSSYEVKCHGDVEFQIVGIWAAFEIAQKRGRLPDAFVEQEGVTSFSSRLTTGEPDKKVATL